LIQATDLPRIWGAVFMAARRLASDPDARYVVLVRPNRSILAIPCPPAGSIPDEQAAKMSHIIPPAPSRAVVVIAPTEFANGPESEGAAKGSSELVAANKAIPFFGLLSGLAYTGHSVWIFDGQMSALQPACRDADLLLIDSILAPKLTTKTVEGAALVMRNANILVHDRNTFGLRALRKVGTSAKLEFA
jgi:hypothetical protein